MNTLPKYVLDRKVIINNDHEHYISGYKLAKASEFFKRQLVQLRQNELEKYHRRKEQNNELVCDTHRIRARSLCDLECEPLIVNYSDIYGLECLLSYIHCNNNIYNNILNKQINSSTVNSMLKTGLYFQVPKFINYCLQIIQNDINKNNCWNYWKSSIELKDELLEFYRITSCYLLANFIEAGENEEFLKLNIEDLKKLLKEDSLNCSNEKLLFILVERWINYRLTERQLYISQLLKCLRLGRLNEKELNDLFTNRLIQSAWSSCNYIIHMLTFNPNSSLTLRSRDDNELYAYLHKPRLPYSAIFVIGGWEGNQNDHNFSPSKTIQVYNSRNDTWHRIISDRLTLNEGHAYSGCVLYQTQIYIIGGYISSGPTQTLKTFELTTLTWKFLSPMHEKRNYVCTCILDNVIYAIGGHNGKHRLSSVERYNIDQNYWCFVSPMHQIRSDAAADSLHGRIYVVGGFDGHHFYNSVEMYDPYTDQWSLVAPMYNIRSGVSLIVYGEYLYAIGGNDGLQRLRTVERYNPETNQWQFMPSMIHQRSNFCITILDNMIYVIGGWSDESNSTLAFVERWSPSLSTQWESVRQLHLPSNILPVSINK
ncbi:unnamed protein product [Heterobilharzia americana]|nr:unnamed protein product [Heterobilharzia americana]CAH8490932.1 unnamed protein product [Heterobilharzia americana]